MTEIFYISSFRHLKDSSIVSMLNLYNFTDDLVPVFSALDLGQQYIKGLMQK